MRGSGIVAGRAGDVERVGAERVSVEERVDGGEMLAASVSAEERVDEGEVAAA
jgi:hypothetical protein